MKFIDSNILAYAFYENPFQEHCREIIRGGGLVNTLNLVEAFNIIEYQTNREVAGKSIKGLLKSSIAIVDVDINLIFEALKKSGSATHLKFIDLIHYVSALLNNCDAIASYDEDFDGLDIKRRE